MQFIWATDKKYQRNLYAIKCKAIQSGFYQNIRSIILPYVHENDWYLPDYDLFSLPRFMQLLIESDVKYEDTETEVYKIIDNHFDLDISEKDYIKDIRSFDNVKEDLVKYVKSIFPSFEKVENIYIIPTKFGTLGSFDVRYKEEGKVDFYITHRIGFSWGNILSTIVYSFIQLEKPRDELSLNDWLIRQGTCDFFKTSTNLVKLLPKEMTNKGTLEYLNEYKGDAALDSARYYSKMGYPIRGCFSSDTKNIYFNSLPIIGLQKKEFDVLKLLIENKSNIVTFEEVAKIYWNEEWNNKYSLYSLAKVIEKLRKTMKENKVPLNYLLTVRKRGYMLYD